MLKLEVGYGTAQEADSLSAGEHAAVDALSMIHANPIVAVIVFASVFYDLKGVLRGIKNIIPNVPLFGCTTAGEILNEPLHESVVVTLLASSYMKVSCGLGQNVSEDWQIALDDVVNATDIHPYFHNTSYWNQLTLKGKSVFAVLFSPGNTRRNTSQSYEILEAIKKRSLGRLPVFGGSTADDWRMETNYVFWGDEAFPDSMLLAVFETQLQFGIAMDHGFIPTIHQATVTRAHDHEVLEFEGEPAADVYSRLVGSSKADLEGKHLTLTTGHTMGTSDSLGQYSINVASYITPNGGINFTQPVTASTLMTLMKPDTDSTLFAGSEALRKAVMRGGITAPSLSLVAYCALRFRIARDRCQEEIRSMSEIFGGSPLVGFCSFGEQGMADDGTIHHNNAVISVLVLGCDLSPNASVAIENEKLQEKLERRTISLLETNKNLLEEISERKRLEEILKTSYDELAFADKVFEHSIEGIVVTDFKGKILQVNPAFTAITGYKSEEAIGQNPRILKSDRHSPAFYSEMWEQLGSKGQWSGEIWNRRKDGEVYPEWLTINAVRDSKGIIKNFVSIFHDITELKRQQEALEHQAQHDALTGLPNRVLFADRLKMALALRKSESSKTALLFLDLDNFKYINDTFGHTAGDNLLVELSRRLGNFLRIGDTLARQGGDEFLALLPEVDSIDHVSEIAMRLMDSLKAPFTHDGIDYIVSLSIGVTIAPDDGTSAEVLIKNADMAMYRAKKLGRNNFQFFTPELDAQAHHHISMESKLRKAIELEEFELYYQPLVSSDTGHILGAEALIRWRHSDVLTLPAEFIPLAEESGLILPLGEWVLNTAARQAQKWQDEGYNLDVSINISSQQFAGQNLAKLLRDVLIVTGLEPHRLYFEITETMLMGNIGKARKILNELREEGCKFYLDDFGTGYSSLSYLKRLPIDGLKIDRSFIREINTDSDSKAITSAIVSLAKTLNLAIVAEGVETEAQLGVLSDMSDMLIQGYLASPPVPASDFEMFLQQGRGLLPINSSGA